MPGRRGFLKAIGLGAAASAAGAALGTVARESAASVEPVVVPEVPTPLSAVAQTTSPFAVWGQRIIAQAGCTAECATSRYSEIEGIVALRHEGFRGPLVKLEEDDWYGDAAAVREQTAIRLLVRKHRIWSGDAPSDQHATGGYDWDAETDKYLDEIRQSAANNPYLQQARLMSRGEAMDVALNKEPEMLARSAKLPKRRA